MSRHMMPVMLGLAVFPFAVIGIAAYLLAAAGPDMTVVAGAIMLLAACVFGISLVAMMRIGRQEEWIWSQQDAIRDLTERTDALSQRMDEAEQRASDPTSRLDEIAADIRNLRDGFRGLVSEREMPAMRKPQPFAPAEAAPAPAPAKGGAEHLELLLEPVIELASGSTSHYRARLDLTDDHGHVVRHAELMQKADLGGMRPALDAHLLKQVIPVLRRLRTRNPGLRVFVPLGLSTLGSREEVGRIAAGFERDGDVSGAVVFELAHRDLGILDTPGIENLARFARMGITFALTDVQVAGLDLASLRQLGVRFLSFPPHAADSGFGPSPAWRDFMQYARAMQFQIVVQDIATPQEATAANKFGRYGHGPFFAPPRKVRSDAGVSATLRSASAA